MNLQQALDAVFATDMAISRPYLMDERHSYLVYQDEHLPLKQRFTHTPQLQLDYVPSVNDLLADDWALVSRPDAEVDG
jgi:hypothetical protein